MSGSLVHQWPTASDFAEPSDKAFAGIRSPAKSKNIGDIERAVSFAAGAGLVLVGLSRRSLAGFGLAVLGGMLAARGWSGRCGIYQALGISTRWGHGQRAETVVRNGIKVRYAATIARPAHELYRLWRDFEDLPRYLKHLKSVKEEEDGVSHWIARGPMGNTVEWDARIITDRENEVISWRSLPGADVDSAGSVRFDKAPDERGTEVRIHFNYDPPAGRAGAALAWFFGQAGQQQVEDDLQRFKTFMETGTISTTEGQPRG